MNRLAIAMFGSLALAACGVLGVSGPTAAVVVTSAQNGTAIDVPVGSAFEVRLAGNSTVYPPDNWQIEARPDFVRDDGITYASDSPGAVGAGGTTIFRLTPSAPGRGTLSFNSGPTQRRFSITVTAS